MGRIRDQRKQGLGRLAGGMQADLRVVEDRSFPHWLEARNTISSCGAVLSNEGFAPNEYGLSPRMIRMKKQREGVHCDDEEGIFTLWIGIFHPAS